MKENRKRLVAEAERERRQKRLVDLSIDATLRDELYRARLEIDDMDVADAEAVLEEAAIEELHIGSNAVLSWVCSNGVYLFRYHSGDGVWRFELSENALHQLDSLETLRAYRES